MNLLWWAPRESNPAPTDYEFVQTHLALEQRTPGKRGFAARVGRILPTLLLALVVGCASVPAPQAAPPAKVERSPKARAAFVKVNPCPATGQPRGACPGWVVDHVVPLCAGGADAPANMQWQAREVSLVKDAEERRLCQRLRTTAPGGKP